MIVTVSTVKDTVPNLRRFVERNLAGGVDHLLVFVDDADPAVVGSLNEHPHVTAVGTGPDWWHGKRPRQLNARQRINANVARVLLTPFDWAQWLFHIDADEVLVLDRAGIEALPDDVLRVRARILEAVSRKKWPGGRVTHFKRILDDDELTLLHVLGVLDEPSNGRYFHGHVEGKSGLRPRMDLWHTLHTVHDVEQQSLPPRDTGELARVLHYESWSGEEFVRKWSALLGSGSKIRFRPAREPVAVALRALLDRDLPEKQLRKYLMRIYERTTADDFDTLLDLGLLVEVDPDTGAHRPEAIGGERHRLLRALLAAVSPENKWPFHTGRTARELVATLDRVAGRVDERDPALAQRVRGAWTIPDDVLARAAGGGAADEDDEGQGSA